LINKKKRRKNKSEAKKLRGKEEHIHSRLLNSILNRIPAKIDPFQGYLKRLCMKKKDGASKDFY